MIINSDLFTHLIFSVLSVSSVVQAFFAGHQYRLKASLV